MGGEVSGRYEVRGFDKDMEAADSVDVCPPG